MTRSKLTPRDVAQISATEAPSPMERDGIIPIRGMTPASAASAIAPVAAPSPTPRPKNVPVENRSWQILLVPPTPGEQTRALHIARWQRRLAVGVLTALVLVAGGAVTILIVGMNRPDDMYTPSAELASLRGRLLAVEDSLSLVRAALADAENLVNGPRRRALYGSSFSGLAALSAEGLPVDGPIASGFSNARRHPLLHIIRPHLGVDITAPRGTRIAAPAAGRVTFVGWKLSMGLSIEIQHADGVMTRYAHCRLALVRVGDRVTRGQMIATVGSSGLTTGPHLHYEVWVRDHPVDPLLFRLPRTADSAAVPAAQPAVATPAVTVPR